MQRSTMMTRQIGLMKPSRSRISATYSTKLSEVIQIAGYRQAPRGAEGVAAAEVLAICIGQGTAT